MFSKEFKKAIQELPNTEKDKLIFRLLKRDLDLANRLHFELVDTETVEDKRVAFEIEMLRKINYFSERFYSFGYLLQDTRFLSGEITYHVKITKDKFGDIWLNLYILAKLVPNLDKQLNYYSKRQGEKFYIPALSRIFKVLMGIPKLHEDEQYEFKENLEILGNSIGDNDHFMMTAIHHGLDVNWLVQNNIPENIADIYKDIKNNGFLKLS